MADWIDSFGEDLVAGRPPRRAPVDRRVRGAPRRPRAPAAPPPATSRSGRAVALPLAATSGAATAVVLRQTVVQPPDPTSVPDEQTPLAGTAVVSPLRAKDPGSGLPWTIRVAKSKTGFTCTTVGQVQDGTFGLTGLDGVFRSLPGELSDACGQGGTLTGARIVAGRRAQGRALDRLRRRPGADAGHAHDRDRRSHAAGRPGRHVRRRAARLPRGQHGGRDRCKFADQHRAPQLRRRRGSIPDPGGGQAWAVEALHARAPAACCARPPGPRSGDPRRARYSARPPASRCGRPTAPGSPTPARLRPGDKGTPGFDRWNWRDTPARVVVWGVARTGEGDQARRAQRRGRAARARVDREGAFAAVLPADRRPAQAQPRRHARRRHRRARPPGRGHRPRPRQVPEAPMIARLALARRARRLGDRRRRRARREPRRRRPPASPPRRRPRRPSPQQPPAPERNAAHRRARSTTPRRRAVGDPRATRPRSDPQQGETRADVLRDRPAAGRRRSAGSTATARFKPTSQGARRTLADCRRQLRASRRRAREPLPPASPRDGRARRDGHLGQRRARRHRASAQRRAAVRRPTARFLRVARRRRACDHRARTIEHADGTPPDRRTRSARRLRGERNVPGTSASPPSRPTPPAARRGG